MHSPVVTRAELVRLSAFTLPAAAVRHLPAADRESARRIRGLSVEQVRTLERHGLFDDYRVKHTSGRGVWLLWKPRRRGDTRLYSILDVAAARLVAWMRASGLTMQDCARVLRTEGCARAVIAGTRGDRLFVARFPTRAAIGMVLNPEQANPDVGPYGQARVFPLAWLGVDEDVLPRVRKMREVQPVVWRHRWTTPENVAALEAHG